MNKPLQRSKLRIVCGKIFYILKKYCYWNFSGVNFAQNFEKSLPIEIFTHQTFLRRPLKDVDMWIQENKIQNLKIAIEQLNGLVLESGQIFSYWRQIGNPTAKKGYVPGMILHDGIVGFGIGGGLCQLSNLIYWMTLHTPLFVVERWRHVYDVFPDISRNQPFGTGATCAYPNIDLQIRNTTGQKFQLSLKITDEYLVVAWLSEKNIEFSYKVFEKDHEITGEWWGGYSRNNKIFRKIFDRNTEKEIGEEFVTENHAMMMYNPLLEK